MRHHAHGAGDARDHPRQRASLADVFRTDRQHAVRAIVRRSKTRSSNSANATDIRFFWSRKVSTITPFIRTEFRRRCRKTFSTRWSRQFPDWKTRSSSGLATRSNTITSIRASSSRRWKQNVCADFSRRTDQRHHRLRRGCGTRTSCRSQRGVKGRRRRRNYFRSRASLHRRDDRRSRDARRQRAVSHVHLARRISLEAARRQCRSAFDRARNCHRLRRRSAREIPREKMFALNAAREFANSVSLTPKEAERHGLALNKDGQRRTAFELLSYPNIAIADLAKIWPRFGELDQKSPSKSRSTRSTTSICRARRRTSQRIGAMKVSRCRTISITRRCRDCRTKRNKNCSASAAHDRPRGQNRRHDAGGADACWSRM